jgi:serine/threonine protein kinase
MHLDRWNCVVFSKGKFGETVVKSFPKLHAVAGFSEFSQNSYISECDKKSHGGRPKYIVTVSSTVSVDPNGFAFETPRAICTYAEFMTNPLRAPEIITPGFVLNRLVRGVMYMRSIHVAHGDIKPANIFMYRNNVVFGDFGHAKLFLKGHDLARQTPSGTEGYRHPWPADKIHPQIGDVISRLLWCLQTR